MEEEHPDLRQALKGIGDKLDYLLVELKEQRESTDKMSRHVDFVERTLSLLRMRRGPANLDKTSSYPLGDEIV